MWLTSLNSRLALSALVISSCGLSSSVHGDPLADEQARAEISYYGQIRPIFQAKCQGCHQPAKALGEYVMTSFQQLLAGGETGDVAIIPGKPDESYLVQQITPVDGQAEMPQKGAPLEAEQIALIRAWIHQGARDDTPASAKRTYDAEHPPTYVRPPVITSLDYSPDGTLLAIAGFHEVLLQRADGSGSVGRLVGLSERIESVRFSPDGAKLAVTAGSPAVAGEVQVWDVASQQLEMSVPTTFDTVYGVSWSPDQKLIAFGCSDSTVRAIDSETGEQVLYQGSHNGWVCDTVFSVDGSHLVSVADDMTAKLIEVKTQRFVDNITSITPKALKGGINSVVRHPKRDQILFGGADGIPKIYRMHRKTNRQIGDDANQLWELPPLPGRVFSVDYSADATRIAAGSSLDGTGSVHVYGIDADFKVPEEIDKILVKPTHQRSADERSKLDKYFDKGIETLAKVRVDAAVYAVSLSPDGMHVAAAGSDGTVRLIDATSGSIVKSFVPVEIDGATGQTNRQASAPRRDQRVSLEPEPLPKAGDVVALACEPSSIKLDGDNDYTQLIVSAKLASEDVVDVTRLVQFSIENGLASISASGRVIPAANGTGVMKARLGDHALDVKISVQGLDVSTIPDYVRDVMPVISRAGCNAGTCHGAKDGKNGFKLSLRGYDPIYDVRAFTDDMASRRVNFASPSDSLMLRKPTGSVPHEGGQVIVPDSKYYQILHDWIADGAKLDLKSPRVAGIEVYPVNPVVQQIGGRQQMRVVATYANGDRRDVTSEAFIESGNTDIVEPIDGHPGLMSTLRRGEAPILVRFEGAYAATTVTVMGDRTGFQWLEPPRNNAIDGFVAAKLKRTKTLASALCDDYEFVRRAYLDLTGLPPSVTQIRSFVDDPRDSRWKRDQLIDQLVGSKEYVDHWSNKWADLLQVNRKFLGTPGAAAFRQWIHDQVEANIPYDQFVRSILTADGSNKENPAASYFKILRTPQDTMENTTHLFLATRFNCNKCHDHPFERWTQDQYYEMAAFFARVGLKKDPAGGDKEIGRTAVESGKPLYEVVFDKTDGEVKHERTGQVTAPNVPYQANVEWDEGQTRRQRLAAWITSPDNQYFAKSYVNRLWGYLTGVGIIEPIDDIRAGNPPTNPELLDWLTRQFVESGFNTQHVIQLICKSRTYQLSIETNPWNEDDNINFSHAQARRLPAEVLYDAIHRVTGAKSKFPGVPAGTRAAALPDVGVKLPDGFLGNLGRPARESACECERSNDLQLGPVMALVSGPTVGEALVDGNNDINKLVAEVSDDRALFNELFLRVLNRPAKATEIAAAIQTMQAMDTEHESMTKRLARAEQVWKPKEAELEANRWAKIAATEKALLAYQDKTRKEVERKTNARLARIAAAESALAAYEADIDTHLLEWEYSDQLATQWETLDLLSMKATHGAKLEKQADGSVFVSGKQGRGNYDLTGHAYTNQVTGVRIEALVDDRLPKQGPGRADDGNFVLSELKVQWADPTTTKEVDVATWTFENDAAEWSGGEHVELEPRGGVLNITSKGNDPSITRKVAVPGKLFMLELEAKLAGSAESQLFWSTKSQDKFDEARSVKLTLVGEGQWLSYRYYFTGGDELTALRLDPDNKPGRFQIRRMKLYRIEGPKFENAVLVDAQSDFSQKGYDVRTAIDGRNPANGNGWAISPETGKPHQAIFALKDVVKTKFGADLKLLLQQNFRGDKHALGRFRVSITSSPVPLDFGLPKDVGEILTRLPNERSDVQKKRLLEYFRTFDRRMKGLEAALARAKRQLPEDPELTKRQKAVAAAKQPIRVDPALVRLRSEVEMSGKQLRNKRLTAAQDVAWALINNPAFLFNH